MSAPSLVTAIPAFNEGDRLHTFLQDLAATAHTIDSPRVTVVVVDDGSREIEAARHQQAVDAANCLLAARGVHQVRFLRSERNHGKGASIRFGWNSVGAEADWFGFVDGDGALPAREFWRLAAMLTNPPADVICGSRIKMSGHTIERSLFRHLQGRAFATAVDELFHLGHYDTQCGLKFFRASFLRPILPILQEDRWLLDVELLARLRQAGACSVEVPVDCFQRNGTTLIFGVDSAKMLVRLLQLRRKLGPVNRSAS
jgi:dolichyl-phosphate beta-glucosyltransferase